MTDDAEDREVALRRRLQETEEALARARADLAAADRYLRTFVGQLTHDLRTPLTAALANAEMLAAEPAVADVDHVRRMAAGVSRAVRRMNEMLEDIDSFADADGPLAAQQVALGELVDKALAELAPLLERTDAEVTVGPLPTLTVDPRRVHDALQALLDNAVKFARADQPPRVHVSARRVGAFWRVTVSDNGIGIPPERQEAAFVPLTRVDKRIDGRGLGLARVKRAAEAHGGRVGMQNQPGGGLQVWFEVPAQRPATGGDVFRGASREDCECDRT